MHHKFLDKLCKNDDPFKSQYLKGSGHIFFLPHIGFKLFPPNSNYL